ncbi:hypothetical protein LTR65_006930 [Meristemomyces frigidus]
MAYQGSAVIGDFLYLDGGEMKWLSDDGIRHNDILNDTLSIPLSTSWTNSTVPFAATNRGVYPEQPSLNFENLWPSNDSSNFYVFGGELSGYNVMNPLQPVQPSLWQFTADGSGGGSWSTASAVDNTHQSLNQPSHALATSGNGVGYALGGMVTCGTYADPAGSCGVVFTPVPGLVVFNMSTNSWSNISASGDSGYSTYGTAFLGSAQFAPSFGSQGVVLFVGGQTSDRESAAITSPKRPFSQIGIFDPSSQTFHTQTTSGDTPAYREHFCSVGAQGDNGTYEIFIYGGVADDWYVATPSNATANGMD